MYVYITIKTRHYSQIDAYDKKEYYFSGIKTFWVIQNNSFPLECINKLSKRKSAKQINIFDFSTLYTNNWNTNGIQIF